MEKLTHFDEGSTRAHTHGRCPAKPVTERLAIARGDVRMAPETLALIVANRAGSGPARHVRAWRGWRASWAPSEMFDLIPLCHPLPVETEGDAPT